MFAPTLPECSKKHVCFLLLARIPWNSPEHRGQTTSELSHPYHASSSSDSFRSDSVTYKTLAQICCGFHHYNNFWNLSISSCSVHRLQQKKLPFSWQQLAVILVDGHGQFIQLPSSDMFHINFHINRCRIVPWKTPTITRHSIMIIMMLEAYE